MGGVCVTNKGKEKCIQDFCGETWRGGGHMEDLVVCGRIILKCMLLKLDGRAWNWVHLAQDTDK